VKIFYKIYNFINPRLSKIRTGKLSIQDISYPSEKQCIALVRRNGTLLKYISYQTDKICQAAIYNNPNSFQYVINPSNEIIEYAIRSDPSNLQFVSNQSEEFCIQAIKAPKKYFTGVLQYIKNQTPAICKAAVERSGYELEFVKEEFLSNDLCHIAIRKNARAIALIKNPTDEMMATAIKKYPYVIKKIKNPSVSICILALECSRYFPEFQDIHKFITIVPNPTYEETLRNLWQKRDVIDKMNKAFSA
jgi:hypothetical protein